MVTLIFQLEVCSNFINNYILQFIKNKENQEKE